ncbi:zf-TFIIB domain-containing protein [Pseudomonas oryzihabitans]
MVETACEECRGVWLDR